MASDKFLSEIERQQKYLNDLPDDFSFPLFNAKKAVESQRRSGYRDTAAASREIVDNGLEAGASRIDVVLCTEDENGRTSNTVKAVAFIDDGSGMLAKMVRYALTWGGGTHFDDHDFIGRFGFGLPNSSINQTRRVEVYSRFDDEPYMKGVLDITNPANFNLHSIDEPVPAELPRFVQRYAKEQALNLAHSTVVVWVNPDRLTFKRPENLIQHMVDDFAVTYRYLLRNPETNPNGFDLVVAGEPVVAIDPLFVTPGAPYYLPPDEGGAIVMENTSIPIRYFEDAETGERHLQWLKESDQDFRQAVDRGDVVGTFHVKVVRFPVGFANHRGKDADAIARHEIRKSRRGMSFVRAGREIQTVDLFPRTQKDKAAGLGVWPLLQGYAYHWGIEVKFEPALDEVFGITNDKQSVRPLEDFWRVLADAEIDAAAMRENRWQSNERKKAPMAESPVEPTAAEEVAQAADVATNQRVDVPEHQAEEARKQMENVASRKAQQDKTSVEEAQRALEEQAKRQRYSIEYVDGVPGGAFFEPQWVGDLMVMRINRQHQFYQVLYGDLLRLRGAARAKEALDVFLIALGRTELTTQDEEKAVFLAAQRRFPWSQFLEVAMADLATKMTPVDDEQDEEDQGPAEASSAA